MEILLSILSKTDDSEREVQGAVGDGLVIGRGAEDGILLEGGDLSREHVVLTHDGSAVYITDLSANGTWVNGKRLKKSARVKIRPEDSIEVPGYILTYRIVEPARNVGPVPVQAEHSTTSTQAATTAEPSTLQKQSPLAALKPVSDFYSSFTAMEKIMFVVAICGLTLLYTYATS